MSTNFPPNVELSGTVPSSLPVVQLAVAVQQAGSAGGGKQMSTNLESLVEATKLDIEGHLTRFQPGSRGWVFDEYMKWLSRSAVDGDTHERERAFIVYGEAGVGNSGEIGVHAAGGDPHPGLPFLQAQRH